MAMCSVPPVHQDLYNDMRAQFPELPDAVIQSFVQLYPRNRAECIEHLTRASQDQLYSQFDSEELSVNREGMRPVTSRLFEPLEPPFPVDQDLPPPYPGVLTPVTPPTPQSPFQRSPQATIQATSRITPLLPPHFPTAQPNQPLVRTDYRPQVPISMPSPQYGPGWSQAPALDSPMNQLRHSPPAIDNMIQTLLTHQRQRLELLQRMYAQQVQVLQQLRSEVEAKESRLMSKHLIDVNPSQMEELRNLRRRNRTLNVECHCLLNEVDLYSRGEVPLGATDEHFYQRLNPGQTVPHPVPSRPAILSPPLVQHSNASSPRPGSILSEDEENQEDNLWKCSKCTFLNHPALESCEVCEMPKAPSTGNLGLRYLHQVHLSPAQRCYCHTQLHRA